ncbi:MAG: MFS transporter [Candidatus Heimdallarchaeaceae archaeon]
MTDSSEETTKQEVSAKEVTTKDSLASQQIKRSDEIALYSRTVAVSTSRGLVQPFVSMIALTMGASSGLLGWIQSISNLLATFLNPVFGRLSDLVRKRIPFIVISTLSWGIPYAFLFFVKPNFAWTIVIIVAMTNLLLSLGVPSFSALQNELFPAQVRGKLTGRIFWFDAIGSMIATIFTGIVLTSIFKDQDYQKFILIPVAIGIVISILGVLPFKKVKEPLQKLSPEEQEEVKSLEVSFRTAFSNKPFAKFTIISTIHAFFFSFAWPLFSIFQVNVLHAKALQIAVLSISFNVTTLLIINFGAKLSDRFGRTKLIFFNRFCLSLFPLAYIFAKQVWHLYIIHFTISAIIFIGSASVQAYLLDIVPSKEGGMYFGIFNMVTGVFLFLGSLAGGYFTQLMELLVNRRHIEGLIFLSKNLVNLTDLTTVNSHLIQNLAVFDSLRLAIVISLAVATTGRFLTSLLFLSLKEMKKFPSSWGEVYRNWLNRRKIEPRM